VTNAQDQPTVEIVESLRNVLIRAADPNDVLKAILEHAVARTGADRGLFAEVSDNGAMEYQVMHGFTADHFRGDSGAFSRNLFSRVVESGEDVMLERADEDPFWNQIPSFRALRVAAVLCMPVRVGEGIGAVIHLESRRAGHFDSEHQKLLRSLLSVAGPAIEALRAGRQTLLERDSLRAEAQESRKVLTNDWSFRRFVGCSPAVSGLETTVRKWAASESPILLLGETGVGKTILARVLHHAGNRKDGPFVTVSCPSLEKGMLEAELFGCRKGAFTDATDRTGKVQAADGGTLFLDEIGELPLELQPKLLRFMDCRTFERLGESREHTADVRIIAATNKDLNVEVQQGRFRRDLFERLRFLLIRIPPLRERREDLPLLLRDRLDQIESGRWITLTPEAVELLRRHESSWPGNVRNVEQLAARLAAECGRGTVSAQLMARQLETLEDDEPASGAGVVDPAVPETPDPRMGLFEYREHAEKVFLQDFVRRNSDLTRAEQASMLKIGQALWFRLLRKHGLIE